jgi:hypothetical protein
MAVNGPHVYLSRDRELTVIATANRPQVVARYVTAGPAGRLSVANGRAFVALPDAIEIVDVSQPSAPTRVRVAPIGPHLDDVQVAGRDLVITDGDSLQVWQLGDGPCAIGRCEIELARRVTVAGTLAYVAADFEGMVIVDLSDPTRPRRIGQFEGPGDVTKIALVGSIAYVADYTGGLSKVDVSDPGRPKLRFDWDEGMVGDIAATARHVFAAMGNLAVLDASGSRPRRVATCETRPGDTAWAVECQGDRVYALGEAGLSIWAEAPAG